MKKRKDGRYQFQSTPSLREMTVDKDLQQSEVKISIHTFLVEGDININAINGDILIFQSIVSVQK